MQELINKWENELKGIVEAEAKARKESDEQRASYFYAKGCQLTKCIEEISKIQEEQKLKESLIDIF